MPFPSGARDASIVSGCPTTIVASAGSSPRSASLTARETPSRPGRQVHDRGAAEPLVALPARRLRQREVDLHLRAAVAEPLRRDSDRVVEQPPVELRRRHVADHRPRGADRLAAYGAHADGAVRSTAPPRPRRRLEAAAVLADQRRERVGEPCAAAARDRHAALLHRDARSPPPCIPTRPRRGRGPCAAPRAPAGRARARTRTSPRASRAPRRAAARRTRPRRAGRAGDTPAARGRARAATRARCRGCRTRGRRSGRSPRASPARPRRRPRDGGRARRRSRRRCGGGRRSRRPGRALPSAVRCSGTRARAARGRRRAARAPRRRPRADATR